MQHTTTEHQSSRIAGTDRREPARAHTIVGWTYKGPAEVPRRSQAKQNTQADNPKHKGRRTAHGEDERQPERTKERYVDNAETTDRARMGGKEVDNAQNVPNTAHQPTREKCAHTTLKFSESRGNGKPHEERKGA